jgi:hypothetical protein
MIQAKCWIYKRATLVMDDDPQPTLVHYTNGTQEFTANIHQTSDGVPIYLWTIADQVIPIPLNIAPQQVTSIIRMGSIPYTDANGQSGQIQWECIFGKYRTLPHYYLHKCLPVVLILIIAFILFALSRRT